MKVLMYFGFTLMSVLIQFCVMDFIQEKNLEESKTDLNNTSQKKKFEELLNMFDRKPHGLYYRKMLNNNEFNLSPLKKIYHNNSITQGEYSTIISSTILDELYDENISTTEDTFTTETLYTTTEFDNITEISLYDKIDKNTTTKPMAPKKYMNKYCGCNFLYKVCDINCCCDTDCSDADRMLFESCKDVKNIKEENHICYSNQYITRVQQTILMENLLCIAKTNLPQKRNLNSKEVDKEAAFYSYKWHKYRKSKSTQFQRRPYVYGEPLWVLKEGSIWFIDTPSATFNNYCNSRKPIRFLRDESVTCMVNVKDLEMFQILKTSLEAPCISVTEKSMNSTALDCSALHCSNWTIIICDENGVQCDVYNKSIHEPSCEENECTNLALRLDYIFYYSHAKIVNATIKLYVQKITAQVTYMNQEVNVKFLLTNDTADVVMVSGAPGYIEGLPVIVSFEQRNHSYNFFNTSYSKVNFLSQPYNKNGLCVFSNNSNFIMFGLNRRLKCRYIFPKSIQGQNSTNACDKIEYNIKQILGLSKKYFVSPFGNPADIKDDDWIQGNVHEKEPTYGQFQLNNSKLRCYNLLTGISYTFTFADVSENSMKKVCKIVVVDVIEEAQNVTFSIEDISTVLTIDTNFIDGTKPKEYEFAKGPHLNIYLPKDFFFPFLFNGVIANDLSLPLKMICCALYYKIK